MKKITILTVLAFALLMLTAVQCSAADTAPVNYVFTVTSNSNNTLSIGETVTVTVSAEDIAGGETQRIYGFNGCLNYDSYLLELTNAEFASDFSTTKFMDNKVNNKISFVFLCSVENFDLKGVSVKSKFDIGTFTFKVKKNGTAKITLSDLIVTDKEANERYISSWDSALELTLGNGNEIADVESIKADIASYKAEISKAYINVDPYTLNKDSYTVSKDAYDAFVAAMKKIEAQLTGNLTEKQLLELSKELSTEYSLFCEAKIYGMYSNSSAIVAALYMNVYAYAGEGGTIVSGYAEQFAIRSTSVTVKFKAKDGYRVDYVTVNGAKHPFSDGYVTIPSVDYHTVVRVYFAKVISFKDVAKNAWYYDAVDKIVQMKLFNGTSEDTFSPDSGMTRAMLVTVLHRLEGTPKSDYAIPFKDVEAGAWYTDAVAWATEKGIVNGYDAVTFGTNDSITRQDIITVLYRYSKYKGENVDVQGDVSAFVDFNNTSDYAVDAMKWAVGTVIVKGTTDTTLAPKETSTRAQVATLILRYTERYN